MDIINPIRVKPGIMLRLSTKIEGGVRYQRKDLGVIEEKGGNIVATLRKGTGCGHTEIQHNCRYCYETSDVEARDLLPWNFKVSDPIPNCACWLCRNTEFGRKNRMRTENPIKYPQRDTEIRYFDFTRIPKIYVKYSGKVEKWETTKTTDDPEEYQAAVKARADARNRVAKVCISTTAFGTMVPAEKREELAVALKEARAIANEHNATAKRHFVGIYWILGEVAADDAEAARSISSAIRDAVDAMKEGIKAADPKKIRDSADEARKLAMMIGEESKGRVDAAIEEARAAARKISAAMKKGSGQVVRVIAEIQTDALDTAKVSFLDLDSSMKEMELPAPADIAAMDWDIKPPEDKPAVPENPLPKMDDIF